MIVLNAEDLKQVISEELCNNLHFSDESFSIQTIKNGVSLYFFGVAFFRLVQQKEKVKTEIKSGLLDEIKDMSVIILKQSPDKLWYTVSMIDPIDFLKNNILQIYEWCYELNGVERIGCCSRFNECSDEKKCVQPDMLLSKGCYYRQNLEKGKIFYGKNRNV